MTNERMLAHMQERTELAIIYAKDGAFGKACDTLLDLQCDVRRHARERAKEIARKASHG